jgi:ectoine utilization protein EutC
MPNASFIYLTEQEIRSCVGLDAAAIKVVEDAFVSLSRGEATVPPPMEFYIPEKQGEVHIKSAVVKGMRSYALKIASGFYGNSALGLQNSSGIVIISSTETGYPQALLLDNGYLTDVRTAIAGAIAAKHLAKKHVETVGIIGVGIQARFQLEALTLVRDCKRVVVYGRKTEATKSYCDEMRKKLGIPVMPAASIHQLVGACDIVVTTTPSKEALIFESDLHAGLHITAMGSDLPGKQELDAKVLSRVDRVVCDRKENAMRSGELQHGFAAGALGEKPVIAEIGEIISGDKPGRTSDNEITVCDLTGIGVQDTAIGLLAYQECTRRGLGTRISD